MATTYSTQMAGVDSKPAIKPNATDGYEAHLIRFRATITLASQASGDNIVLADVPSGMLFAGGELITDTSLATATLAIGIAGTTGKYRTAAVQTATDTPSLFGNTAQYAASALAAPERIIATIGVAALPASGNLVVDLYFSHPN